jgi:hypothetical protein
MEDVPRRWQNAFDSSRADLVLRSCDGVDFRVEKVVLVMSSPFFETMLSLPQPLSEEETPEEPPFVKMAEDSRTLCVLLEVLYPNKYPKDVTFA